MGNAVLDTPSAFQITGTRQFSPLFEFPATILDPSWRCWRDTQASESHVIYIVRLDRDASVEQTDAPRIVGIEFQFGLSRVS